MLTARLQTAYLMYVEVMAATVGVCPVANKSGFAKNSRTETGTHSNPRMMMARCHTKPTNAYFFAPYAYSQHRMPTVSTGHCSSVESHMQCVSVKKAKNLTVASTAANMIHNGKANTELQFT